LAGFHVIGNVQEIALNPKIFVFFYIFGHFWIFIAHIIGYSGKTYTQYL